MTHERGRGNAPGSSAHYWTLALLGLAVLLRLLPLVGLSLMDARRVQEDLAPVLKEMSEFLPADGPPAE